MNNPTTSTGSGNINPNIPQMAQMAQFSNNFPPPPLPPQMPFPPAGFIPPIGFPFGPPGSVGVGLPPNFPAPPLLSHHQIPSPTVGLISASAPVEVGTPNPTLYLQNLPEKPNPLKHLPPLLIDLFSPFGPLKKSPIVRKGLAFKGQAWIIFENQVDAEKALKSLQGTRIWGKSLVIRFARSKSDCIILDRAASQGVNCIEALEAEKKIREADRIERGKTPRITRRQLLNRLMSSNPSTLQSISISGPDVLLPNRILFIQNIPPAYPTLSLSELFKRYPGFQDLRSVPNRPDVAFVEYESEGQAGAARQILDKTEIVPGCNIRVSFARR